jgi:hypothetical protein
VPSETVNALLIRFFTFSTISSGLWKKKCENKRRQKRRELKLEEYTNNILTWGLWQTEDQVDFHLNTDIKSTRQN